MVIIMVIIWLMMDNNNWLVVKQPLWKIWKSIGIIIPNIEKNKTNHQPDNIVSVHVWASHSDFAKKHMLNNQTLLLLCDPHMWTLTTKKLGQQRIYIYTIYIYTIIHILHMYIYIHYYVIILYIQFQYVTPLIWPKKKASHSGPQVR